MKKILANQKAVFAAGGLLLLLVCYQLAIRQTVAAWGIHRQLQQQLSDAADLSSSPAYLARKNANLNQIIKTYQLDSVAFRNSAINNIAGLAENRKVRLITVPNDDLLYHTPQFIVQKLNLEGRFFDLLKLTDDVQRAKNIGLLRSLTVKAGKTPSGQNNSQSLALELYLEIYRK